MQPQAQPDKPQAQLARLESGRTDGQTDRQKTFLFYRSLPLSEALPCLPPRKRKNFSQIQVEQGNGTADLLMPVGVDDWF